MVSISKEKFVEALTNIEKGIEKRDKFNDAIEQFCDSYVVLNIGEEWLNTALSLLEEAVGDKDNGYGTMISWYLFEGVEKKIYISAKSKLNDSDEDIEVDVSTPEALYDYFVKYGGQ